MLVFERLVEPGLGDIENDVIFFLWPGDGDFRGKVYAVQIVVLVIAGIGGYIAIFVIDDLPVGQKVLAAEDDFAGKVLSASDSS